MTKEYESDFRKSNPGLHILYVKWACRNLAVLDRCIHDMDRLCKVSILIGPMAALIQERQKLVDTDAAYADADEIIRMMAGTKEYGHESKIESEGCEAEIEEPAVEGTGDPATFMQRRETENTDFWIRSDGEKQD